MMTRSARFTLVMLALVCTLPVVASYAAFYVWQPQGTVNYGELLTPAPLPEATLEGLAGQPPVTRATLEGHWTLAYAGEPDCGEVCRAALYAMRQAHLAQGKESGRVERLWLVAPGAEPAPDAVADQRGLRVARADAAWLQRLPDAHAGRHVYLVDPLGNVMMRFPEQPDIKRVIKDLQRLLKYSGMG